MLNDVERNKLRLGLKVGIFYFQYTLLKQKLKNREGELPIAPRGVPKHKENEPEESLTGEEAMAEENIRKLARHNQPSHALAGLSAEEQKHQPL